MGIYEVVIIICAVVIFIILVRRFPDTSEHVTHADTFKAPRARSFHIPKPHLNIPKPRFQFRSHTEEKSTTSDPFPFDADTVIETAPSQPAKQAEPCNNAEDFARYPSTLRQLLRDANKYFDLGQLETAEKLYLQAAAADPTCTAAYYRLGVIYSDRKDTAADAEEALNQANKFEPDNGYILNALGLIAFQKGLFHEAIGHFEKAVAADPNIAARYANMGMAHLSSRQYAKASRNFAKAWSIEPNNDKYKELLADAKERERRQRANRG